MKFFKRLFIVVILLSFLLANFYIWWLSPRYTVPILMYHRFGYKGGSLFVTPGNFEKQMAYLKDNNYKVISLNKLVESTKENKKFHHKTVVITIDDGYEDNYTYAYPILKKYDYPATVFIVAGFIGEEKDFMNWKQARIMAEDRIFFGGHTKNNVYLPMIKDKDELWEEISGCKKLIEKKLKKDIDCFCYPTGGFSEEIKKIVKEAGYKGACTTNRGYAQANKDVYELKRIKIKDSDGEKPLKFWVKLSGYYNLFRSKKNPY